MMGIGFECGPPRSDGKIEPSWFGTATLTCEQLRELSDTVESWGADVLSDWGASVLESREAFIVVGGDCEEFRVERSRAWLSKPSSRDPDEFERLTELLISIAEWAGWICVGDNGLISGGELHCTVCGAKGFTYSCPQRHDPEHVRLRAHVTPRPPPKVIQPGMFDALCKAATSSAVRAALKELDADPPLTDPQVVLALLLSPDWVDRALDAIERLGARAFTEHARVLDARLRQLAMLSDDPDVAARAEKLR